MRPPSRDDLVGLAVGAGLASVTAVVLRRLPDDVRPTALAQLCGVFGAIEVGAALRASSVTATAVEATAATTHAGVALWAAARRPGLLPWLVAAHGLWDLGQLRRPDAAPPTPGYPAMCAAFDLVLGGALLAWR